MQLFSEGEEEDGALETLKGVRMLDKSLMVAGSCTSTVGYDICY